MIISEAPFDDVQQPLTTKQQVGWKRAASIRRTLLTILVLAQSVFASTYMTAVLPYHGGTYHPIFCVVYLDISWVLDGNLWLCPPLFRR